MDYEGYGYIYFDEHNIFMSEGEIEMMGLEMRLKIAKKFSNWAREHKVDLMPSALIAWMEMQGWLDVKRIEKDMEDKSD